jgi:hypothetical protein
MKAYVFRHQRGGAISTHVFAKPPTDDQMAAMNDEADAIFGPGWGEVREVELVEDDTVPSFGAKAPAGGGTGEAFVAQVSASQFISSGVGHVENPPGFDPEK